MRDVNHLVLAAMHQQQWAGYSLQLLLVSIDIAALKQETRLTESRTRNHVKTRDQPAMENESSEDIGSERSKGKFSKRPT